MGQRLAQFLLVVHTLVRILIAPGVARADEGPSTLVLIVEGGAGPKLRNAIATDLPSPWTRPDAKEVAAAAKKRDLAPSPKALESPTTKGPYLLRLGRVAQDVGAKGSVAVLVSQGKERHAHVVLVTASGATKLDADVPLGLPADDAAVILHALSSQLPSLLQTQAAPAAAAPAKATQPEPTPTPEGPSASATPAATKSTADDVPRDPASTEGGEPLPTVVGTVGFELASRHLSFRDAVTPLDSEDSGLTPTPTFAVDVYPAAGMGRPYLQDIGVFGDLKLGLAGDKTLASGTTTTSVSWTRFDIGVKYRIFLTKRAWKAPTLAPSFSYGAESYTYGDSTSGRPLDTPAVGYKILRPRLDLRVPIAAVALLAGGGYLGLVDSGEVANKFKGSTVFGWEADLGIAVPIAGVFEVRAGFAYRRYVYAFSPEIGDPNIANGAIDQVLRMDVGLSARF